MYTLKAVQEDWKSERYVVRGGIIWLCLLTPPGCLMGTYYILCPISKGSKFTVLMIHLIRWYNDIRWSDDICHRLQMYYVLCPIVKGSKFMVLMIKYIPPYIIVEQSTVSPPYSPSSCVSWSHSSHKLHSGTWWLFCPRPPHACTILQWHWTPSVSLPGDADALGMVYSKEWGRSHNPYLVSSSQVIFNQQHFLDQVIWPSTNNTSGSGCVINSTPWIRSCPFEQIEQLTNCDVTDVTSGFG